MQEVIKVNWYSKLSWWTCQNWFNRTKVSDIRAYNVVKIDETFKRGGSLGATKKFAIGRDRMYALRDGKQLKKYEPSAFSLLYISYFTR